MKSIYARRNRLSEIMSDVGQVCFASLFFHFILNKYDLMKALVGLLISIACWTFSLLLVKIKT